MKNFRKVCLFTVIFTLLCVSNLPVANAGIYSSTSLKLEVEDYYDRSYGTIPFENTLSIQEYSSYSGETNDSIDEWLRFQPVDFKEGYRNISIRYAHNVTAYTMSVDIYDSAWNYYGNVTLPSTGSYSTYSTATATLSSTLSGKKDINFLFRDSGNNLSFVSVDYITFGNPLAHTVNTGTISNWSLFSTGKPDITSYASSNKIVINGNGDYVIENKKFYPNKGEYAIEINNHQTGSIVIRNCYIGGKNGTGTNGTDPGNGRGIKIYNSNNVKVENNYFDCIQMYGVWAEGAGSTPSNNIVIANNKFYCIQGEYYEGSHWGMTAKMVQFFNINGTENKIWYNRCFNYPGISFMTDWINIYASGGTSAANPVKVYYNEFLAGANYGLYNNRGAGIQICDHTETVDGGQYVYAKYNKLLYPGMVGMNINGGYKNKMWYNTVYSTGMLKYMDETNRIYDGYVWTGLCLFNYSGGPSRNSDHSIIGNQCSIQWGVGFVDNNNPSAPNTTITDNDWNAMLYPLEILPYTFMN